MARKKPEGGEGKRSLREKVSDTVDKAFRNYDEFVEGANRGVDDEMRKRFPKAMEGRESTPAFDPAGFVGGTKKVGQRIWKAASASPGEGGFVREGRGIWNKLKEKLGSSASDDEVARAAHNYSEMWTAGENTDDLVSRAVRATKGEGAGKTLRHESGGTIADEVPLLTDTSRLNKVKKPASKDDEGLEAWKKLEEGK